MYRPGSFHYSGSRQLFILLLHRVRVVNDVIILKSSDSEKPFGSNNRRYRKKIGGERIVLLRTP